MNRVKKTISNVVLILGSFLFVLFILEAGVRIFIPVVKPAMIVKKASPKNLEKPLAFLESFFEGTFLRKGLVRFRQGQNCLELERLGYYKRGTQENKYPC
ncbi:MAG: hypothetical protein KJ593_01535 [Candidatus Omnitrophica bacterium]|nr:hypothetical protein [Candidatus Omnitrophota bacterium]